jgi:hypothetical protein
VKFPRRQFLHLAACATALPAMSRFARAQAIRRGTIVVPFPAGGALSALGLILAEKMRASFAQTVIVENVSGASGSLGAGRVARAAPDGYTLVIGYWGTHVANGAVYALPYGVAGSFELISLTETIPMVIVSKNAAPARNLRELIGWLVRVPICQPLAYLRVRAISFRPVGPGSRSAPRPQSSCAWTPVRSFDRHAGELFQRDRTNIADWARRWRSSKPPPLGDRSESESCPSSRTDRPLPHPDGRATATRRPWRYEVCDHEVGMRPELPTDNLPR